MAAISGKVAAAVQSKDVPTDAPATAYVAIPLGSSSEAPVTSPGPRTRRYLTRGLWLCLSPGTSPASDVIRRPSRPSPRPLRLDRLGEELISGARASTQEGRTSSTSFVRTLSVSEVFASASR